MVVQGHGRQGIRGGVALLASTAALVFAVGMALVVVREPRGEKALHAIGHIVFHSLAGLEADHRQLAHGELGRDAYAAPAPVELLRIGAEREGLHEVDERGRGGFRASPPPLDGGRGLVRVLAGIQARRGGDPLTGPGEGLTEIPPVPAVAVVRMRLPGSATSAPRGRDAFPHHAPQCTLSAGGEVNRMVSRVPSPLKIPRAWTVREAACLLDLHPKKVQRMIHAGTLRGFKQTSYRRLAGPPYVLKWQRLYVASDVLYGYMRAQEATYAQELDRRRQAKRDRRSSEPGPREASAG